MIIEVLGGAREVGKSSFLVKEAGTNVLLDYGVKLQPEPGEYPPVPEEVDAIFPSHAHLDHCGAIPLLSRHKAPIYTNKVSAELIELLLKDSIKIARIKGYPKRFTRDDVRKCMNRMVDTPFGKQFGVGNLACKLYDAGHIPGSFGIMISSGAKAIYYTGDTKLRDQRLLSGCAIPKEKINTLILESTYGDRDHPKKEAQEHLFRNEIDSALNKNEHAIIPVFAVGRAQEILLALKGYENYIALDGMAKEASRIILANRKYIKGHEELKKIFKKVRKVENDRQRANVLKKPSIIVTTSGMLSGGPVAYYLKKIKDHRDSCLIMVGFQVEGSPGKILFDTNIYRGEEEEFDVRCKISRFDFSSHSGRSELLEMVKKIRPEKVICVHGDNCPRFAKEISSSLGIHAEAPKNGDVLEI